MCNFILAKLNCWQFPSYKCTWPNLSRTTEISYLFSWAVFITDTTKLQNWFCNYILTFNKKFLLLIKMGISVELYPIHGNINLTKHVKRCKYIFPVTLTRMNFLDNQYTTFLWISFCCSSVTETSFDTLHTLFCTLYVSLWHYV